MNIDIAGKLFPNPSTMLVQLISTGILFYFVKKLLWLPAREYLEKRANYAQEQIAQAETLRLEAEQISSTAQLELRQAGSQARDMLDKVKTDSLLLKESILKDAKTEAESKLESARKEIAFEKQAMRDEVAKEIVDVALLATEKLMLDKLTDDDDRKLVEKFVKEVSAK